MSTVTQIYARRDLQRWQNERRFRRAESRKNGIKWQGNISARRVTSCKKSKIDDSTITLCCPRPEFVCGQPIKHGSQCFPHLLVERFAWDPEAERCLAFLYRGCDGNGNRFESRWTCEKVCKEVTVNRELRYAAKSHEKTVEVFDSKLLQETKKEESKANPSINRSINESITQRRRPALDSNSDFIFFFIFLVSPGTILPIPISALCPAGARLERSIRQSSSVFSRHTLPFGVFVHTRERHKELLLSEWKWVTVMVVIILFSERFQKEDVWILSCFFYLSEHKFCQNMHTRFSFVDFKNRFSSGVSCSGGFNPGLSTCGSGQQSRWYFNDQIGLSANQYIHHSINPGQCLQFRYSGCGGNSNRFNSEQQCLAVCQGRRNGQCRDGSVPFANQSSCINRLVNHKIN